MTFGTAVRSCFSQYVRFAGRAPRSEYWFFVLFAFLVDFAAAVLWYLIPVPVSLSAILLIVQLALVLPSLAVTVRRLHDTDRSGAWVLINLIPFGGVVLLVFICMDSQPQPNRYGPSPKYPTGAPGWPPYGQQQLYPQQPYGQQSPPTGYGQ